MAGSVNKVILVGNLGQDPELRDVGSSQVCNFSIATSEKFKDRDGNQQERTEWHKIVCWGKMAETAHRYLSKGRKVYIEGKLQTRSWDDKDTGQKRYMTEVVATDVTFLDSSGGGRRGGDSDSPAPAHSGGGGYGGPPTATSGGGGYGGPPTATSGGGGYGGPPPASTSGGRGRGGCGDPSPTTHHPNSVPSGGSPSDSDDDIPFSDDDIPF